MTVPAPGLLSTTTTCSSRLPGRLVAETHDEPSAPAENGTTIRVGFCEPAAL